MKLLFLAACLLPLFAPFGGAIDVAGNFSLQQVLNSTADLSTFHRILNSSNRLLFLYYYATGFTLFAPSNKAIAEYNASIAFSPTQGADLEAAMAYSLVLGNFPTTSFTSGIQYARTGLVDGVYTNVTGGQRVILTKNGDSPVIISRNKTAIPLKTPNLAAVGGLVHIVDTVLQVPTNLAQQSVGGGFQDFVQLVVGANLLDAANFNWSETIRTYPDLTFFAPNSPASLAKFRSNSVNTTSRARQEMLEYHIVNDSSVHYATDLTDGKQLRTKLGANLTIHVAPNGTKYVNGARIIASDYLLSNGVVHYIDALLDPKNTTAPSFTAATTNATPGATSAASPGNGAASSSSTSSSSSLSGGAIAGIVIGVLLGLALIALLAFFLLRRTRRRRSEAIGSPYPSEVPARGKAAELLGITPTPEPTEKEPTPRELSYVERAGELSRATSPRSGPTTVTGVPSTLAGSIISTAEPAELGAPATWVMERSRSPSISSVETPVMETAVMMQIRPASTSKSGAGGASEVSPGPKLTTGSPVRKPVPGPSSNSVT